MWTTPHKAEEQERIAELRQLNLLLTAPEEALDKVTRELAEIFDVPGAFISFIDEDTHYYKSEVGLLEELKAARSEPRDESPCTYIVETNEPLVIEDLAADERFRDSPAVLQYGVRFYAGAPLRGPGGHAVGSLCIIDQRVRTMSERERRLLDLLAAGVMAQVRLQNASRQLAERTAQIEHDLTEAVKVQRFLLPDARLVGDGWTIEHLFRPVEHLGGDLIDVQRRTDGGWAVLIADVSGHGTPAALSAVMTKTAFVRAAAVTDSPARMLTAMNRELAGVVPPGRFVTAQIVVLDPAGRVSIAAAGHPYPLLRQCGEVRSVTTDSGAPLLIDDAAVYRNVSIDGLGANDAMLLHTDGASEAADRQRRQLGDAGLKALLSAPLSADAVSLEAILHGVMNHAENRPDDDVAMVLIRRQA